MSDGLRAERSPMSELKEQKYHKWITEADILDSKRVTFSTLIVEYVRLQASQLKLW